MVLDVSGAHMGDHAYFTVLADEIEHGGTEAFLHLLLTIKLRGYNPRVLPQSDALHAQQVETLMRKDAVAGWWLHVLSEAGFPLDGYSSDWDAEIAAVVLQDSYTKFTARFGALQFGTLLRSDCASCFHQADCKKVGRAKDCRGRSCTSFLTSTKRAATSRPSRELTHARCERVMPAMRFRQRRDCANARIYWARHTNHTNHFYFEV